MPPKKAAKKHAPGKDLRRAYEHLGRVHKLMPLVSEADHSAIVELVQFSRDLVHHGSAKQAADLLRATEHLAFGCVRLSPDESSLAPEVIATIKEEFQSLMTRAEEFWEGETRADVVRSMYKRMRKEAALCLKQKQFREALELARGAEAITHVDASAPSQLAASLARKSLERVTK
jgi:hypothetical protein